MISTLTAWYSLGLGLLAVSIVYFAVSCGEKKTAENFKKGYATGTQLLDVFSVEDVRFFIDATTEGQESNAFTRGLYQALEDSK
jgi:hypothetical protein